ncbi:esterase/lipase family protein [Streptomyces sp. NPDC058623]|uniref:esterase/lipase family protein n=1 Tax=Streptomyces sp. NPDC058623 TaxID=3346563 RepID=UPI00365974E1
MIRNLSRSVFTLLLALMPLLPTHASAANSGHQATGPDPVVFVHGWNSDGSTWQAMADRLRNDGWPDGHLDQWTYNAGQSNTTTAKQLADEVQRVLDATGATKVDIVTHSMGALSSRHYLKNLGGTFKVDAWVSLAGPNHGTETARWCAGAPCIEMRPGSTFLNNLNSDDETPGTPPATPPGAHPATASSTPRPALPSTAPPTTPPPASTTVACAPTKRSTTRSRRISDRRWSSLSNPAARSRCPSSSVTAP